MIYKRIKLCLYLIGFFLSVYLIFSFGLEASHTPPLGFSFVVLMIILGIIWIIVDFMISFFVKSAKIEFVIHYVFFIINLLIAVSVIYY